LAVFNRVKRELNDLGIFESKEKNNLLNIQYSVPNVNGQTNGSTAPRQNIIFFRIHKPVILPQNRATKTCIHFDVEIHLTG
jgi:hypothetical protein